MCNLLPLGSYNLEHINKLNMDLVNGFARMSEEEQWTLIEMMNNFLDEKRNKKISKKKSSRRTR